MILALFGLAWADPVGLRPGGEAPALVIEAGTPSWGLGWWMSPDFGLAVTGRGTSAVEVAAGWRWGLQRGARGWGLDLSVAPGVVLPLLDFRPAPSVTGAALFGYRGSTWAGGFGVVLPVQLAVDSRSLLQVSPLLEPRIDVRAGPVWLGARGAMGARVDANGPVTLELAAGLSVRIPLTSKTPRGDET